MGLLARKSLRPFSTSLPTRVSPHLGKRSSWPRASFPNARAEKQTAARRYGGSCALYPGRVRGVAVENAYSSQGTCRAGFHPGRRGEVSRRRSRVARTRPSPEAGIRICAACRAPRRAAPGRRRPGPKAAGAGASHSGRLGTGGAERPQGPDREALNKRLAAMATQQPPVGESYRVLRLGGQPAPYALVINFGLGGPSAVRLYTSGSGRYGLAARID